MTEPNIFTAGTAGLGTVSQITLTYTTGGVITGATRITVKLDNTDDSEQAAPCDWFGSLNTAIQSGLIEPNVTRVYVHYLGGQPIIADRIIVGDKSNG